VPDAQVYEPTHPLDPRHEAFSSHGRVRQPEILIYDARLVNRVLIVEDDRDLRRMFRTALTVSGFHVMEAPDGLDALRLLDIEPPDLVILDLGLPLVSSHVVRQELAAQAHTRDIPVVVVTGSSSGHADLNVACLLRKPVAPEELVATVRRCLASGAGFSTP
jgi:DNA-binding response OmpR family regulator